MARAFDTYTDSVEFDDFINQGIPIGKIIIAACKDDCMKNMSEIGKKWFINLGSK